jgi:hypothetical protein
MLDEATLDISGTFAGEAIRFLILFAAQHAGKAGAGRVYFIRGGRPSGSSIDRATAT